MSKILLLDRDGVINHKAKCTRYVETWDDFVWIDENVAAMQKLSRHGFSFIVITNQAGIGRGVMTMDAVEEIHANMLTKLAEKGVNIKKTYVCPHHPEDSCQCRKPQPGMLNQAASDFCLNKDQICFIGDEPTDCLAAFNAGVRSIYLGDPKKLSVLTHPQQPFCSMRSLFDCIQPILGVFDGMGTLAL